MSKTLKAVFLVDSTGVARGVDQAKAKISELEKSSTSMGDSFDKQTSRVGKAFSGLGNAMATFGVPFSGSISKIGTDLDKAKSHASGYGQVLSDVGKVAGGVAVAGMVGFAAESVKMAGDFQQQMSKLITSGGELQSNLAGDFSGVEKLMASTGTSSQQLAAGLYTINSAGFHGADGLNVLKAAAQGAKTENADVATVTDGLTTMLNDYGLKASAAAEVTSKMVMATSLGKTTFQDLAGSLHTVSPAAQAAGLSLNEVLGAMATMTAKGTPAADAATYLRQTILQLSNPSKVAAGEMQGLGLSAYDVSSKLGQRGLTGTLDLLTKAIAAHVQGGAVMIDNLKQAAAAGSGWASKLQQMTPAEQDQIKSLAGMGVAAAQAKAQLDTLSASGVKSTSSAGSLTSATNSQTAAQTRLAAAQARLGALQQQYGVTDTNTATAAQSRLAAAQARLVALQDQLAGKTKVTASEQNRLASAEQAVAAAQAKAGTSSGMTAAQQNSLAAAQRAVDAAQTAVAASGAKVADAQSKGTSSTAALQAQIKQYDAAVATLPPAARKVLDGLVANQQGYQDLNSTIAKLPPAQQTAVAALAKMTGGTKSMQAALELTGVSAYTFQANVKKVAGATTEAGGNVAGWATVQKNFNQKLAESKQTVNELAIRFGSMLIPYLEKAMSATKDVVVWFEKHKSAAEALAGVIGGVLAVAFTAFTVNKIAGMIRGVRSAAGELRTLEQTTVKVAQTLLEKFGIIQSSAETSSEGVGQAAEQQAARASTAAEQQAAQVEQAAQQQAAGVEAAQTGQQTAVETSAASQATAVESSAATQATMAQTSAETQAAGVEAAVTGMATTAETTVAGMETTVTGSAAAMSTGVSSEIAGMATAVDGEVAAMATTVDTEIAGMATTAEGEAAGMAATVEADSAAAMSSEAGMGGMGGGMGMLGAAGGALGGGMMAYQGYQGKGAMSDVSLIGGSALAGAAIGSVIPGLGTLAGAGIGAGIGGGIDLYKHFFKAATGGIVTHPMVGLVGEAGPEAIIPMGDPNAFAQFVGANASALPPLGGGAMPAASAAAGAGSTTTIQITVMGNVASEQDLVNAVWQGLLQKQQINGVLFANVP
ncbi:phage tail tape measure protein [Acidiferrimicrobium sp. IK]|uniref:phage tail tape measure protein n=1 Tax=Acidiferrimicrobium sp. IK TaxID=2871700 RepID=UPI0021CB3833|nr:phage tail tape measure protein [Acidiferrimicrobium sp. IK]MCU4184029.1 phage tail tape measure protein [Acidiferrimicrobium sp. IK]